MWGAMHKEQKRKRREGRERDARRKKRREERQGNKNVVDGGGCRCRGATVRTRRRVYLSCFYRLARTSGPGYVNVADDDDDDDEDDDDKDEDEDEEKARNKVGEGRTAEEW
ncbi:hypothetical protein DMN91_010807 [Ooceraea biroi]|uniref:Uncharacterized protein n=1 Tax=Ooceraea biroi TaxID=2015173 RepID=A0A3L8DA18_OOCBI|nr:hypothetical protein DMN91_010807 [Ooceraea biroi]